MSVGLLDAQDVRRFRDDALAAVRPAGDEVMTDAARVDLLSELEKLKSAACALQAELTVDLDASVRSRDARQGVAPERQGRGVAAQVAMARQESPHRASMLLGLAKDLATDLGCTHQALREGRLNEFRAQVVARESGCLGRDDRAVIDEEVCGTDVIDGLGTGALAGEIRKRVQAADPSAVARRNAKAEEARRVNIRPTPDTMVYLTGLLPVAQGVKAFACLTKEADRLVSDGDERTKGQIMADLLVERLTGQTHAQDVGVTVDIVISDEALLGAGHEPACVPDVPGCVIPAQIARELIAHALRAETISFIRNLYADSTGRLVAMTSRQRFAPDGLADFLAIRDQGICRTPWCDAPIRHIDHIYPHAAGGQTTDDNTQGLCQACNHAKQADGWTQTTVHDDSGRHTVETTTPTGHHHRSRAPTPPTPARPPTPATRPATRPAVAYYRPAFDIHYVAAA
jgi:hypothetical protein